MSMRVILTAVLLVFWLNRAGFVGNCNQTTAVGR